MFSSLLSKPKRSEYSTPIILHKTQTSNNAVLVLPDSLSKVNEVHIKDAKPNTVSKYYVNDDGTLNYNLTVGAQTGQKFHASYEDTIPLKQRFPNLKHSFPKYHLDNCPDDSIKDTVERTREIINHIIDEKSGNLKLEGPLNVSYKSRDVVDRGRDTQIEIRNYQEDPMLPPKHKLRKNRHQEPSPPPPILKNSAGSEKLSKEDHAKWNIPAAISNWKNNQGFTISLDKRMQAASTSETPKLNLEKMASLTSALDDADRQAREDIKIRNELRKEMIEKQKKEKEEKLKQLAELTRLQRGKRDHQDDMQLRKRSKH